MVPMLCQTLFTFLSLSFIVMADVGLRSYAKQ